MDPMEQLKIWQDEMNQLRAQQIETMERHLELTIAEFVARFRSHKLHDRTWRPIKFNGRRPSRMWVEFQISKRAMVALLA